MMQKSLQNPRIAMKIFFLVKLIATLVTLVRATDNGNGAQTKIHETLSTNRLLVIALAYEPNHEAFARFNRSVEANGLDLVVLGATEKWSSGSPNDLERMELVRKAVASYKSEQDLIIMIVLDSNNLILNGGKADILDRFEHKFKSKTRIVFLADANCWPDPSLGSAYPLSPIGGERFLSSDVFIGYAPSLWDLLNLSKEQLTLSPTRQVGTGMQLHFTQAYLKPDIRQRLAIELDHRAQLFQNLHSSESNVELEFNLDKVKIRNSAYLSEPVVVHGQPSSRVILNSLGNYLGKAWTVKDGCRHCNATSISLAPLSDSELPSVLIALFIEEPTPFIEEFFLNVRQLNYPRNKIHLVVHNLVEFHEEQVRGFINKYGSQYASERLLTNSLEWEARTKALELCKQMSCDYYLALDSVARLEMPDTLRHLIEANKTIVAPLLSRPTKLWSNFWGSLTDEGYYARSHDYVELVKRDRVGLWNVAHLMNAYLIEGQFIKRSLDEDKNKKMKATDQLLTYFQTDPLQLVAPPLKPVLAFSRQLRNKNVFMYMLNTHEFGHLVDPTNYNTSLLHPDFYQLSENMVDWERRYLHENYSKILEEEEEETKIEQPCQDVLWFPLVNDLFCKQMIEIMETFGHWSGGTNEDPRIEGGYESVPTRDIHLKQVGLHEMWLTFLREYIMPVQLKEYIGYEHDPPRADLAFVVRYHPAEQPSLRPHHDASTYTLNIALNAPGRDYEGGGCRFIRYNCSVTQSRPGWALMHPGRLTHYHEGLSVTNGTRYIMVTFVDP